MGMKRPLNSNASWKLGNIFLKDIEVMSEKISNHTGTEQGA